MLYKYKKKEDVMMWELHEVRKKLEEKSQTAEIINQRGKQIVEKYRMTNSIIKSTSPGER